MSTTDAWKFIFDNWNTTTWKSIPQNVKDALKLDARLGMCSGMLVTVNASRGLDEFIVRMNRNRI